MCGGGTPVPPQDKQIAGTAARPCAEGTGNRQEDCPNLARNIRCREGGLSTAAVARGASWPMARVCQSDYFWRSASEPGAPTPPRQNRARRGTPVCARWPSADRNWRRPGTNKAPAEAGAARLIQFLEADYRRQQFRPEPYQRKQNHSCCWPPAQAEVALRESIAFAPLSEGPGCSVPV